MGIRLLDVRTAPTRPPFGEPFELGISIRVAGGLSVTAPDTLPFSEALAPAGSYTYQVARAPADSVDIDLRYPVIALLDGPISLPALPLRLAAVRQPSADSDDVRVREGEEAAGAGGTAEVALAMGIIQVQLPDSIATATGTLEPRPAVDPLGGVLSPWALLAVLTLLAAVGLTVWVVARSRAIPRTVDGAAVLDRNGALRELDVLLGRGWHRSGEMREFYDALTGILRRFARGSDPRWAPGLTNLELAAALAQQRESPELGRLKRTVGRAEEVRFGRLEPPPEEADEDWTAVRRWIAELPGRS